MTEQNTDSQNKRGQLQFSCRQCGSAIHYQVGSKQLACQSCGKVEYIDDNQETIDELPLDKALDQLRLKPLTAPDVNVTCENCGATSQWDIHSLSDLCPYCQTPIAKLDTDSHRLQIEAIVPFFVSKSKAFKHLDNWMKKRWFAPNVLKQMSGHSKQLNGIYVPHWTFDSLTYTDYRGRGGIHYMEPRTNREGKVVMVQRTRWFPASGQVRVIFDDVLVLASMLIPRTIVNRLSPWRLNHAKPYTAEYLAGLKANYYQLDLDDAFNIAKQKMASEIDFAIRRDIGGDVQEIWQKQSHYQNSTYKLILLPVWHSAFEYQGKKYQIVINGQTGKVAGQYPKSPVKIAIAVIFMAIIFTIWGYFAFQQPQ